MTYLGTRPILQDELQKYELHHRARIAIKPGITGMWQVSGRSDITDFEEVVRLDTEYIRSRTYLIMAAVFLLIAYYKQLKNKQLFYFSIIPIALISAVIIFNSDMMQYFLPKQVGVFDFWGSFTSGRTVFWAKDFEAFKNANIMHRLFGQGYNLVYYVRRGCPYFCKEVTTLGSDRASS